LFTRLGFTAFGGPAVHTAMMEDEVVTRRKWLDRGHFLDLVAALNFIPGPNSTELAIHLGLIRAGLPGLLVAGLCFITPAVLIILPLAWAYCAYGTLPAVASALAGVNAVVVAIVLVVLVRFGRTALRDPLHWAVAVLAVAATVALRRWTTIQPELIVLAAAALVGLVGGTLREIRQAWRFPAVAPLPLAVIADQGLAENLVRLALFFLKVGGTLFGSGYVLVSYLHSGLVLDYGWLTPRQLADGISIGQVTPGPLLTTATFLGYVVGHTTFAGGVPGGVAGALVATVAIFLPSFVLVALCAPLLQRLRQQPAARGALDGMNAAVVALIAVTLVDLARVAFTGPWPVAAGVLAAGALTIWRLNPTWLIAAAATVGFLASRGLG